MAENTPVEALRAALSLQRKYEQENWPFVDEKNQPTSSGESITYHLAGLYCWSPEFVLGLEPAARLERLKEIWRTFSIAGDIIKRYEDATVAFLNEQEPARDFVAEMHEREGAGLDFDEALKEQGGA